MPKESSYNLFFREPDDASLRSRDLWEKSKTPLVKEGPGCPLACIYCNQKFLDTDRLTGEKLGGTVSFGVDGGVAVNDRVMIGTTEVLKADQKEIALQLAKSPFYTPDMAVIVRNFTDPGL